MGDSRSRSRSRDRYGRSDSRDRRERRDEDASRHRDRDRRDRDRDGRRDREAERGRDRDRDAHRGRDYLWERDDRERDRRSDRERERERERERDRRPIGRDPGSARAEGGAGTKAALPERRGDEGRRGADSGGPLPHGRGNGAAGREGSRDRGGEAGTAGAVESENGEGRKEPISLEELLKRKQEEAVAAARPVFLTKQQRQEQALRALEERRRARETELEAMRHQHASVLDAELQEARQREARLQEAQALRDPREREKLLQNIRRTYLGGGPVKKRKVTAGPERDRFKFEWGAEEDTLREANPLLSHAINGVGDAPLLFGRGTRGGVDRELQMRENVAKSAETLKRYRTEEEIKSLAEIGSKDHWDKREKGSLAKIKHWSEKKLEDMDQRDWRIFFEDFSISYKGSHADKPLRFWHEMRVPKAVLKAIDRLGWKDPSPIQRAAIPLGLSMRDVIGIAETGSGKTCAFVVPMIAFIAKLPKMTDEVAANGPYAIIMAPTRELAQQIEEETRKLMHYSEYRCLSVVGGESLDVQASALRRGAEVVIATPGRVCDHIERQYLVLSQCNYIVLDEADRMIDLGLELQVNQVMDAMPKGKLKPEAENAELDPTAIYRITYMFSATMPPTVERIAKKYMRNPVVVTIGVAGDAGANITQRIVMVSPSEKDPTLFRFLQEFWNTADDKKVIVFANTKATCDIVQRSLERQGYSVSVLHSGKTQEAREHAIRSFREGANNVLLATDIAGRGIDVPDVSLVVNYEMPQKIEPYTHRIGRTGRAGKKGTAVSLVTAGDSVIFYDLKKLLEKAKQHILPELARHEAAQRPGGGM